ncbi:ATP-dependent Clp protease proteolytic subunit-related protein 4, chloroplastic [Rhododendron vialii]|uniref:ATP-dependent Clp protease proteolytic subunit-related protein 4, chloroplastic n=1 Tax=Rhododendron vialii TaxID=182163 RepID=UPI00265FB2AB|nr:ATP-dependent Clp protease proteolytic subunit-related protein 4, chloroplastic [Rhododendron vialii]XP_058222153.1 ATP-dependent Clp protease proteolytic subunit-related protein 4, chloroplastic [Rhododendron vialii]
MASHVLPTTPPPRMLSPSSSSSPKLPERTPRPSFSVRTSLSTSSLSPHAAGSFAAPFSGLETRPASLAPRSPSPSPSRAKRSVVTMGLRRRIPSVLTVEKRSGKPFNKFDHSPPDLDSYYFQHRIVFLTAPLLPTTIEMIMQELLFLAYEDLEQPIYMYINSTGTMEDDYCFGREREAFVILDHMRCLGPPVFTLCVGHAWGEAALILASGVKGHRTALPSSTIMIREPMDEFEGQASNVEGDRKELQLIKQAMVEVFAERTGKTKQQIETDIRRPKYFSASEAVEYGLIDKVLSNARVEIGKGAVAKGQPVTSGI